MLGAVHNPMFDRDGCYSDYMIESGLQKSKRDGMKVLDVHDVYLDLLGLDVPYLDRACFLPVTP